jgi:hypothetical protein
MNQFHEGMSRVRRAILVFAAFFPLTFLSRAIFGKQAILPDVLLIGAFFTLAYADRRILHACVRDDPRAPLLSLSALRWHAAGRRAWHRALPAALPELQRRPAPVATLRFFLAALPGAAVTPGLGGSDAPQL